MNFKIEFQKMDGHSNFESKNQKRKKENCNAKCKFIYEERFHKLFSKSDLKNIFKNKNKFKK